MTSPEPEETPLTVWFNAFPTEHYGSADFTVRIAFSEDIRDNISVMRYSAVPNTGVNTDPVESAHADWPGSRDSRRDCTGRHVQQQALVRLRRGLRVSSGGKNPEV